MFRSLNGVHIVAGVIHYAVFGQFHNWHGFAVYFVQERPVVIAPVGGINISPVQPQLEVKIVYKAVRGALAHHLPAGKAFNDVFGLCHQRVFFFVSIVNFVQIAVVGNFVPAGGNALNNFGVKLCRVGRGKKGGVLVFFFQHPQNAGNALLYGIQPAA